MNDRTPYTRPERAPRTAHEQRDVNVLGMRLRYVDLPALGEPQGPPLLLAHGHSSRIEEYEAILTPLRARRRVLVCDLPGSGYSDKPDREYSLRLFEDTLLGFLDAMGVREAHLGGGSLGGNLVLRMAHREPERFSRIAAWAPAGAWVPSPGWQRFARTARHAQWAFFPSLWIQSRFWYSPKWDGRHAALEGAWKYYREVYGPGFHRMYWDIGHDQARTSLFPLAPDIRQPVWLGVGDQDHGLDMFAGVKKLATMIPGAKLTIYQGARHSLANEIADKLAADVDAFLAGKVIRAGRRKTCGHPGSELWRLRATRGVARERSERSEGWGRHRPRKLRRRDSEGGKPRRSTVSSETSLPLRSARAETKAARKIVQVSLAVLVAGTIAAAMSTHGAHAAAHTIGRLAAYEFPALGVLGFTSGPSVASTPVSIRHRRSTRARRTGPRVGA